MRLKRAEYLPAPQRFEAGTQRISQVIALATAIKYLRATGMERIQEWGAHLGQRLVHGLQGIDGIRVAGPDSGQPRMGLAATTRASTYLYNTTDEIDSFLTAVAGVRRFFRA